HADPPSRPVLRSRKPQILRVQYRLEHKPDLLDVLTSALPAIDDGNDLLNARPGLTDHPRGFQHLPARSGDVLDQQHDVSARKLALKHLARAVPLLRIPNDDKRQAGRQRRRGRQRHAAELRSADQRRATTDPLGKLRAELLQNLRLRLKEVLIDVESALPPRPK